MDINFRTTLKGIVTTVCLCGCIVRDKDNLCIACGKDTSIKNVMYLDLADDDIVNINGINYAKSCVQEYYTEKKEELIKGAEEAVILASECDKKEV